MLCLPGVVPFRELFNTQYTEAPTIDEHGRWIVVARRVGAQ